MALDSNLFDSTKAVDEPHESANALRLFGDAASYELHQAAFGLAQAVGLQDRVGKAQEPTEADSAIGKTAQMLGHGAGAFLPTAGIALVARFGVGRLFEHSVAPAEGLLLKRSAIGLNAVESAATGFMSGALLKPTDELKSKDWTSFASDRLLGGVSTAASFTAMNMASLGWNKFATGAWSKGLGADVVLGNSVVSGAISGLRRRS